VRRPDAFLRRFPGAAAVASDFNRDVTAACWLPRLAGIDAVINCAGVLQGSPGQSIEAIHLTAPKALFEACRQAGVRRVIQISAISADPRANTPYARTKHAADMFLRTLDLDWIVLRPSLIYAAGSYGGTSLLRALAATPWRIPVVGDGGQLFQPIHVDDLTRTILVCLDSPSLVRRTLDPVGPETLSLAQILRLLRAWMGFPAAPLLRVPLTLVRLACRVGDVVGAGPLRTTSLKQIEFGNVGDPAGFSAAVGFVPRAMDAALRANPAQAQDRWHARLTLLRPALTLSLALLWLVSGLVGLVQSPGAVAAVLAPLGLPGAFAPLLGGGACALDLVIAALLVAGWKPHLVGRLQLGVVVGYTVGLTVALPSLWLDPFGPLLKNVPVLAAIAAWLAIAEER
jgi:uncharacterized protein YbjT (DUF2867 family)